MEDRALRENALIQELLSNADILNTTNFEKAKKANNPRSRSQTSEILKFLADSGILNQGNFEIIFNCLETIDIYKTSDTLSKISDTLRYLCYRKILNQSNFLALYEKNINYLDSIRMIFHSFETQASWLKNDQHNFSMLCKNAKYAEDIYSSFSDLEDTISESYESNRYRSVGFSQEILDAIYKNPQYAKRLTNALHSMEEMNGRYGEEKRKILLENPKYSKSVMLAISVLLDNCYHSYSQDYKTLYKYENVIFNHVKDSLEIAYALRYLIQIEEINPANIKIIYENIDHKRDIWGCLWILDACSILTKENKLILESMPAQDIGVVASSIRILGNTCVRKLKQLTFDEISKNPNHAFLIVERLGVNLDIGYDYPDCYIEEFMALKKAAWIIAQGKHSAGSFFYAIPTEVISSMAKHSAGSLLPEETKNMLIKDIFRKYAEAKKIAGPISVGPVNKSFNQLQNDSPLEKSADILPQNMKF